MDLVNDIAAWADAAAPKPMWQAALTCALATVGGIASRSYNIGGTGLNNYFVLASATGTGKGNIQRCFNKLVSEVAKTVPGVTDIKGPSYLASGQALVRHLSEKPYPIAISMLDEIGHDLEEMANPKNANGRTKEKVLLQLWPISGKGNVYEPMAYADSGKNTKPLESPAFTFAGTTTTEKLNETMCEASADNGFHARLIVIENCSEIPPDNEHHEANFSNPPIEMIRSLSDLTAHSLNLAHQRLVQPVQLSPEAQKHFQEYGEKIRKRLNASAEGPARHLWNRNGEKARKLAAIYAVGRNYLKPCVTLAEAQWATNFVDNETARQFAKFANGETGTVAGDEVKQLNEIIRAIGLYKISSWHDLPNKSAVTYEMHRDFIITETWLSRYLLRRAAYRDKDATRALKRAIDNLLNGAEIAEMNKDQLHAKYGRKPRSFCVLIADRFVEAAVPINP